MKRHGNNKVHNRLGFTLLEVLITLAITGLLATASLSFYVSMHNQTINQMEISDMQYICRASLHDIKKTLRMAGWKIDSHKPYEIQGDSLYIFYGETQPVDTMLYFLQEYSDSEYAEIWPVATGMKMYKLMKKK